MDGLVKIHLGIIFSRFSTVAFGFDWRHHGQFPILWSDQKFSTVPLIFKHHDFFLESFTHLGQTKKCPLCV